MKKAVSGRFPVAAPLVLLFLLVGLNAFYAFRKKEDGNAVRAAASEGASVRFAPEGCLPFADRPRAARLTGSLYSMDTRRLGEEEETAQVRIDFRFGSRKR